MKEIWKDINGFEGLYQVSSLGNVMSIRNNKILSFGIRGGYPFVALSKNNKSTNYYIHRLVAEAFVPNPYNLPFVNHKDEDKLNPKADNLEWCTASYNINYGSRNKSMSKRVKCIETGIIYDSFHEAARKCGIKNYANISEVCSGKRKSAGGYHWEYMGGESDVFSE